MSTALTATPFLFDTQSAYLDTLKFLAAIAGLPVPTRKEEVENFPFCFQVFPDQKDFRDQKSLPDGVVHALPMHRTGNIKDNINWLRRSNEINSGGLSGVYVVVNEVDGKGRKASNVVGVRALFIELDHGGLTRAHMSEFADRFGASIVVESSPGKAHVYWLLKDFRDQKSFGVCPLEKFSAVQSLLIERFKALKSGVQSKDLSRVLRVPGFMHLKDLSSPWLVRLHVCDPDKVYGSVDEVFAAVGIDAEFIATFKARSGGERASVVDSDDSYIGAESGNRNEALFTYIANRIRIKGFTYDDAFGSAMVANRRNKPPLERSEVAQIVDSALKRYSGKSVFDQAQELLNEAPEIEADGNESFEERQFAFNYHKVAMACPISDESLAERIVQKYGEKIKYCSIGGFYVYNGLIWEHEADIGKKRVSEFMRETFSRVPMETAVQNCFVTAKGSGDPVKFAAFRRDVHSVVRRRAALELLSHRVEIGTTKDQFYKEADSDFIAARNGIVDLAKGELVPASPEFGFTSTVNCSFDPDAECPLWEKFISSCMAGDRKQIEYVQKVTGYLISGRTNLQCLFVIFGKPGTGKSVFLSTLAALLGAYSTELDSFVLIADKGSENAKMSSLAKAIGCRLATIRETSASETWAEGVVKAVTGCDIISAKPSHKDTINFKPQFKLCVRANSLPATSQVDEGLWERLRFVPFEVKFRGTDKQNPDLAFELASELQGIFNWCVKGFQMLIRDGLGSTKEAEVQKVESRKVAEPIRLFVEKCCVECEYKDGLSISELQAKFGAFCRAQAIICVQSSRDNKDLLSSMGFISKEVWGITTKSSVKRFNLREKEETEKTAEDRDYKCSDNLQELITKANS